MYLIVAFAVTILVIVLAWRGIGTARGDGQGVAPTPRPRHNPRVVAPDDDPEFLSEIDRRLRGEDKSN
ncbi:MAG TPA: hypothetical protein VFM01_13535 [Nakamurella sp.]|jgi:hypothetical protein|nr:hypothetical protein [Nakamurella sp.]